MSDRLVVIPSDAWPTLRDKFFIKWPRHLLGYHLINNSIRWKEREPTLATEILSLNGELSYGTFALINEGDLFVYTMEESCDQLKRLLNLIDWTQIESVCDILNRHKMAVIEVADSKRLQYFNGPPIYLFYLAKEKAQKFQIDLPPDVTLKPLSTDSHAEKVDALFTYRSETSLAHIKRSIRLSEQIGAFDRHDELVAWCFTYKNFSLSALRVINAYQRRGLGALIVRAMAKRLAETLDSDTFAFVVASNTPSVRLFEKLGFERLEDGFWLELGERDWHNTS